MATLFDLSNEILQSILVETEPRDLARLSQCCLALNRFVKNNRLLWKDVYLRNFDDPPRRDGLAEFDWETQLPRLTALKGLLESSKVEKKRSDFDVIASGIFDILETSAAGSEDSRNIAFLNDLIDHTHDHTRDEDNIPHRNADALLCGSSLFKIAGSPSTQTPLAYPNQRQMSAKLHVFHGVPAESSRRDARFDGRHPIHCYARARVYDLRRYTEHNLWGPFTDDGSQRVDWEKLECIMIILCFNMERYRGSVPERQGLTALCSHEPFEGAMPYSYQSVPTVEDDEEWRLPVTEPKSPTAQRVDSMVSEVPLTLEEQDPYGITGTWRRVVCFLDYNDLYRFNFETPAPLPGHDRLPNSTQEAIRFITMRLRVARIAAPGPDDGQALPVVHFTGSSHSMHASWDPNANSNIRGTIRLTPEGEIRWTSFSIFHGEERWRSESIQIGGIRSARGVLGTWFDKDMDPHGPAGPTAFWKVSDDVADEREHATDVPLGIFS